MKFVCLLIALLISPFYAKAELHVLTINTEWLWSPHDQKIDGMRFNKGDMKANDYKTEIDFYRRVVKKNGVNILAVSEIENNLVAQDLASSFGHGWHSYFKQGRDTATGQDVAILSNLEVVQGSLTDFGFPGGELPRLFDKQKRLSKVVGVQFWYKSGEKKKKIGVITAHFLSKRKDTTKKAQNRQRQAYALRKAIAEFSKISDSIVVLGDFNDYIDSETLSILMEKQGLVSAELAFHKINKSSITKTALRRIDHILYQNLMIKDFKVIGLKKYSDHDGIFAQFY